jgi:hypothetical protein
LPDKPEQSNDRRETDQEQSGRKDEEYPARLGPQISETNN